MINRKQPIRTYQRKTTKKPIISSLALPVISSEKYNPVENGCFDRTEISNDSLIYDPFETTFDRIAKGAVVPPLPFDTYQNDSWNGSSSDSNINDANVTESGLIASNIYTRNGTPIPSLTLTSVKHKESQRYKTEMTLNGMVSKKTKVTLRKDETQPIKAQGRKRQRNKIQRKKIKRYKSDKSSRICNKETSYVNPDDISNLKDAIHENDISSNNQNEHLRRHVLKIDKTSQTRLIGNKDSTSNFKYTSMYYQNIKPCCVKLNACTVQNWYMSDRKKTVEDEQNILNNVKLLLTDTSQANKDISEIKNTIPQSISTEYNDITEDFKHMSVKQCSVILYDNVKGCNISKSKESINGSTNMKDKLNVSHLAFCNTSKTTSHCNIEFTLHSSKRNRENLVKDSFVRMERLKIEEFVKKNDTIFNEKERFMISSTPIGKHVKSSTCSVLLSPIDINAHNIPDSKYEYSMISAKKKISDIVHSVKFPDQKSSRSLNITLSECCKFDAVDMQEQLTQVLPLSQKSQTIDSAVKTEIFSEEDIHIALTQKYKTECDIEVRCPHSLNMSAASTDRSQSLFDDATRNHNYSVEDIIEDNLKKDYCELAYDFAKTDMADSSVALCLEQKQLLNYNAHTDASSQYITPFKISQKFEDLNIICTTVTQEYENKVHEKKITGINTMEAVRENSKDEIVNDSKCSFLGEDQGNTSIDNNSVDVRVLLTKLQDPIKITARRMQYPKWQLSISNISESLNNEVTQPNNKISHYVVTDEASNVQSTMNNFEHSKNAVNSPLDHFELLNNSTQLYNNDINKQIEKSIFLKPGKYWARSLSILNNVNGESNLNKLSVGKGKKWRHSVMDILCMQKQGIIQSCLQKDKDDVDLSCSELGASNVSSFDNKCKSFILSNNIRISKRISVRVVPNDISTRYSVQDTPFLEAFGITTEKSSSLGLTHRNESPIRDNRNIKSQSTTARDVVLQRCSQNYYLSFSDCFPDSYLEYCRKIGEGVYGEVFLYEYDDKKSVIKIIPIEGEELVNGEPQKKFSEILSEIVIAKELDNLRLNATYRTSGFVEVRSINCIKGKYLKKLVELWNIYDDNKTSDNDCPSKFDENQLYISLELSHGGEDLEAFIFQTAEEAYASFLQIALTLAVAEEALEFEHRDMHWGNVLISRTKEPYIYYNLGGKEIRFPSEGIKVSIIDFTLSRMLYQGCCIYNDLALDPALFTAHGEYQFEIYRLMRDKIRNNWRKFEPYTNVLWLHYTLDKMIAAVRYKRKNLKAHKHAIIKLQGFKDTILNYDSAFNFVTSSNNVACLQCNLP